MIGGSGVACGITSGQVPRATDRLAKWGSPPHSYHRKVGHLEYHYKWELYHSLGGGSKHSKRFMLIVL